MFSFLVQDCFSVPFMQYFGCEFNENEVHEVMNGRRHTRAKLERLCHLLGKDGESYPASLIDISFSGAMVTVITGTHFKTGDLCDLMLSLKTAELPLKRSCEIVRLEEKIVGVKFLS
jgi:hypothetical protein